MFETLSLQHVHLCEVFGNCSIRLSNDWNHFYETTDHLQQFRANNFSTFFKSESESEAFTYVLLGSLNEIHSSLTGNVATHRGFRALFIYCICSKMIPFFWFSLKQRSFLSLFYFRFSIMRRRVFNKTIILLGLAGYEISVGYIHFIYT